MVEYAGADVIGLNFVPYSPRCVSVAQAEVIAQHCTLPLVGLFADPSAEQVAGTMERVPLQYLQFHGQESPEFCENFGLPYLKVIHVEVDSADSDESGQALADQLYQQVAQYPTAWALLFDAAIGGVSGGTGQRFDWSVLPNLVDQRLVLAGGLDVDNVAQAVQAVRPFGVDVSSGVESGVKGVKSAEKVSAFVRQARTAWSQT